MSATHRPPSTATGVCACMCALVHACTAAHGRGIREWEDGSIGIAWSKSAAMSAAASTVSLHGKNKWLKPCSARIESSSDLRSEYTLSSDSPEVVMAPKH